jgi:hypothetical protein
MAESLLEKGKCRFCISQFLFPLESVHRFLPESQSITAN